MIKSKQEVEQFLYQFGIKFDVWGIFYLDRDKNEAALKALYQNSIGETKQPNYLYIVPYRGTSNRLCF